MKTGYLLLENGVRLDVNVTGFTGNAIGTVKDHDEDKLLFHYGNLALEIIAPEKRSFRFPMLGKIIIDHLPGDYHYQDIKSPY